MNAQRDRRRREAEARDNARSHEPYCIENSAIASMTLSWFPAARSVKNGRRRSRPLTSSATGQGCGSAPRRAPIGALWSGS